MEVGEVISTTPLRLLFTPFLVHTPPLLPASTRRRHPYIIDPATRPRGETFAAYNERRWGGSGWTQGLKASGRPDGATFSDWKW